MSDLSRLSEAADWIHAWRDAPSAARRFRQTATTMADAVRACERDGRWPSEWRADAAEAEVGADKADADEVR